MIDFMLTQPTAIKAGFGNIIFYYGVKPNGLSRLAAQSEFTLIYSPSQDYGWEAVHYRVLHPDKSYFVVDRRDLTIVEIQHFERLLKERPSEQTAETNNQESTAHTNSPHWLHWVESVIEKLGDLVMSPLTLLPKLVGVSTPKT